MPWSTPWRRCSPRTGSRAVDPSLTVGQVADVDLIQSIAFAPDAELLPLPKNEIHGHPVEPGAECRVAPERAEFGPYADEYVLSDLVGQLGFQHSGNERMNPRYVPAVQALERPGIRTLCHCDPVGLVGQPRFG